MLNFKNEGVFKNTYYVFRNDNPIDPIGKVWLDKKEFVTSVLYGEDKFISLEELKEIVSFIESNK